MAHMYLILNPKGSSTTFEVSRLQKAPLMGFGVRNLRYWVPSTLWVALMDTVLSCSRLHNGWNMGVGCCLPVLFRLAKNWRTVMFKLSGFYSKGFSTGYEAVVQR